MKKILVPNSEVVATIELSEDLKHQVVLFQNKLQSDLKGVVIQKNYQEWVLAYSSCVSHYETKNRTEHYTTLTELITANAATYDFFVFD